MKKLILNVLIAYLFTFTPAYADEQQDQIERALVASNIFKTACFMMHSKSQTEKRLEFLNSKFPKFENGRQKPFLNMMQVSNGDAWGAVFPKGQFVVVVDYETTNCHLIARKADADVVHVQMKKLYTEADKNLDGVQLLYHAPETKGELKNSGFEVKTSDGQHTMTIVSVSTALDSDESKPEARMSVFVK